MGERLGSIGRLADTEPLRGVRQAVVIVGLVLMILIVRQVDDTVTGVSLGVFYILPVAIAAILCSGTASCALAIGAAITWSLGDTTPSPGVVAINSIFRSMILLFIVITLRALREATRQARASERRSQEFLAFVAHQLRTPTATASATAQALLADGADEDREEAYLRISRETQRIGQLVASTLRFVRLDQDPHPREVTKLLELCSEELARHEALSPNLSMMLEAPKNGALTAKVSKLGVTEALSCVLDNARRHADAHICVKVEAHGQVAVITVADDGPGMPAAVAERAFEPFVALDGRGGTGLGLAIAQRLVEASGGAIRYEPTGFAMRFPLTSH